MKNVDLSGLLKYDSSYDKLCVSLSEKYRCDWDDTVHDSFDRFIRQIKNHSEIIHNIRTSAELIENEMNALNLAELAQKAEALAKEADCL